LRAIIIGLAAAVLGSAAVAQTPPPQSPTTEVTFISQAELAAMATKAPSLGKPGQPMISQPVVRVAPYNLNLEFRPIAGPASVHPASAELFMVAQGSGVLTTGGQLVRPPSGAASIQGGVTRKVAKGDVFLVPANLPHAFTDSDGSLAVLSLHLPLANATPPVPPPAAR
jgi:mannose-6-phosphate isomerase-like protein (cupin superfamily)